MGVYWKSRVAPLMLAVLLGGCANIPAERGGEAAPPPEAGPEQGAPAPGSQVPAPARQLVAEAAQASDAGNQEQAAAKLERALRVAPQSAEIWQNLAVVRYRQDRYDEAESMALKSNSLAGDNAGLKRRNWLLIGAARRLAGDGAGAAEAEQRAAALDGKDSR
jgi:tetratricopeptide (TPR) repeat protein